VSAVKIVTVVGARPQFIKAAAMSRALVDAGGFEEVVVHTGQHHDTEMSQVFFDQLGMSPPRHQLGISGGTHGSMTGRMLEGVERVLIQERPDAILVYGDTNSTLAGAIAAAKLQIPVAHVEAGVRSFERSMPEEVNRVLVDSISSLLFCPTQTAVGHLAAEGIRRGVYLVGDVMLDVAITRAAAANSDIVKTMGLVLGEYLVCTCHRQANTDVRDRLVGILDALDEIAAHIPVVFPLHPRTAKAIALHGLTESLSRLRVVPPLPYEEMLLLVRSARGVATDSGGLQKEAFFHRVPCITLRDETEWPETVSLGWNILAGSDTARIVAAADGLDALPKREGLPFGDGHAAMAIAAILSAFRK
jgi:UDP-GlcNAc3NAcA epimerase